MITWIQVLLQKHHKVVFSILLAVIIVAFVFTIGSSIPSFSRDASGARVDSKNFYGYNLEDQRQVEELSLIAQLDLRMAGVRVDQNTLQNAVLKHAYLMYLAKSLCVNSASASDLKAFIQSRPAFQNGDGSFNAEAFAKFNELLKLQGFDETVVDKILSELVVASKTLELVSGPGYVLDDEVALAYKDAYGRWDVSVALLPFDSFKPQIKEDDASISAFFNLNKEMFRVPEAVASDVIFIPAKDFYSDKNSFTEDEIKDFYSKNLQKYVSVKDGKASVSELKDIKDKVVADLKAADAAGKALVKADEILTSIYDAEIKCGSEEFKKFVADGKYALKHLPFVRKNDKSFPKDAPESVFNAALQLSETVFYKDPVPAEDGAYLVFFRESKPSYIPELKEVYAEVKEAYLAQEKAKAFSENGAACVKAFAEAAKKGGLKGFEKAAKEAGFKVSQLENFSFSDEKFRTLEMYQYLRVLSAILPKIKQGDVSNMLTVDGGGYIVYADKFTAPEKKADAKELKDLAKNAQNIMRGLSTTSVLGLEVGKEL
ncbi:MAG: peptidyl-prolyl cis-trans isomerase [Opitutales bacterium]|nr:peptidyl-prolyl cis-trans isomerase [Opitutales bacterium]